MLIRRIVLLLLAVVGRALAGDERAGGPMPPEVSRARQELAREAAEITLEQKLRIRELKDKHLK